MSITNERKAEIIKEFGRTEQDYGSAAVQVAILITDEDDAVGTNFSDDARLGIRLVEAIDFGEVFVISDRILLTLLISDRGLAIVVVLVLQKTFLVMDLNQKVKMLYRLL